MRRLLVIAALVAGVFAATASASPKSLYTALLTTAYPDSQLPSGFSSAKVSLEQPSSKAKGHHVVGEVGVAVDGPDPDDAIFYAVFPNPSDARADLSGAKPPGSVHVQGKVPGYKLPSIWFTGSITGKNAFGKTVTNGITVLAVADGSVLVGVVTDSADTIDSGNVPAALALLKSARRHLHAVQARVR